MNSSAYSDTLQIGEWLASRATGELSGPKGTLRLEPKVAELLFLLAERAGEAVSRDALLACLWPQQVVGDDSLARAVSKLRQALGDQAKAPAYIETLTKRGYRLIAAVSVPGLPAAPADSPTGDLIPVEVERPWARPAWSRRGALFGLAVATLVGLAAIAISLADGVLPATKEGAVLVGRADDFYFQFSRGDNEAAIVLYERALALDPDNGDAAAGLANALVQRAIRWPQAPDMAPIQFTRLGDAIRHGHLRREPFSQQLVRARQLADRALALTPRSSAAHKAGGFVASAQGHFDDALESYRRAVALDPGAWGAMINIGDVLEITGRKAEALPHFEQAYTVMSRVYDSAPVQVRPWHAELGVLIAQRHKASGDSPAAEVWFRRVLLDSPFHAAATSGLAMLLHQAGNWSEAERLCAELLSRAGANDECDLQVPTTAPAAAE